MSVFPCDGLLLRIFVGEHEKKEGKPLYQWLVLKAREHGLSGATVIRAMEGYGAHNRIHSLRLLDMSDELPVVVEIIDSREKIEAFVPIVDGSVREGMATITSVHVRNYRAK